MLKENILGNRLLLDYLARANILANIAVFADFGINAGMSLFIVNSKVGAVSLAVAAERAAGCAIFCFLGGSILGGAGNHFNSLIRNNGDKMLGAGICTVSAANALIGVYLCNSVNNRNCIISANGNAFTVAKTTGCTHSLFSELKLCAFLAAADSKLIKNDCASSVAIATNKCNTALQLSEIVKLINNNLLAALDGTGNAAHALFIINNSVVINNGDSAFGAGSLTFATGNAAITAGLSYQLIIFLGRRTRYEVGGISRNHADESLRTYALLGAVAAAVTLFTINDNLAINKLHSTFGAAEHAGADTYASVLALTSFETHFYSFSAGFALCEALLAGSASGAGNKGNLLFLLQSTIRSHKIPPNIFGNLNLEINVFIPYVANVSYKLL